jgi:hypothetical protein
MAQQITPEQMIALENHQRHRDLCKQWIKDIATYMRGLDSGNEDWAKKRFIAAGIAYNPNSQDYSTWVAQMTASQKGAVIWDGADAEITPENLDATVDFLAANNGAKYDEMANLVYTLRSQRIEF